MGKLQKFVAADDFQQSSSPDLLIAEQFQALLNLNCFPWVGNLSQVGVVAHMGIILRTCHICKSAIIIVRAFVFKSCR